MWDLQSFGSPDNSVDGTIALPLWAAGVAAGLLLTLFVLALIRTGLAGTLMFLTVVGFGTGAIWLWLHNDRSAERHALQARALALQAQALTPNSALACLDASGGDTVEVACERHVFASPESAAAAASYTAARVALLVDGMSFAKRSDPRFAENFESLSNALEKDRFGVVAHVLAVRKECTPEKCDVFALFRDPTRIRTNLRENTFDAHIARAEPNWSARPVAEVAPEATKAQRGSALPPGYNLPSSESIPPVSIMTSEPSGTNSPAAAAPPTATPAAGPPTPPRRPPPQQRPPQRRQTDTTSPPRQLPPPTRIQ